MPVLRRNDIRERQGRQVEVTLERSVELKRGDAISDTKATTPLLQESPAGLPGARPRRREVGPERPGRGSPAPPPAPPPRSPFPTTHRTRAARTPGTDSAGPPLRARPRKGRTSPTPSQVRGSRPSGHAQTAAAGVCSARRSPRAPRSPRTQPPTRHVQHTHWCAACTAAAANPVCFVEITPITHIHNAQSLLTQVTRVPSTLHQTHNEEMQLERKCLKNEVAGTPGWLSG
nr:TBC1 domain family member 10B-like [Vulpes vulpes]